MRAWVLVLSTALPVHEGHNRSHVAQKTHRPATASKAHAHVALIQTTGVEEDADCVAEYNKAVEEAGEEGTAPPETKYKCAKVEGKGCVTEEVANSEECVDAPEDDLGNGVGEQGASSRVEDDAGRLGSGTGEVVDEQVVDERQASTTRDEDDAGAGASSKVANEVVDEQQAGERQAGASDQLSEQSDPQTATVNMPGGDNQVGDVQPQVMHEAGRGPANGLPALHGMDARATGQAAIGREQDFHARYRRAYAALTLPDACEETDQLTICETAGPGKSCCEGKPSDSLDDCKIIPGLQYKRVDTCMMIHDVISSSLLDIKQDLTDSKTKWQDLLQKYLTDVQMKQTEMELRQKESQVIAKLFTQQVTKIHDDGAPSRRKALEEVARTIEGKSGQQFGEVLQHSQWLDSALGMMPNYVQESEIEALRLWEKYKTERRILERQRISSLAAVRELITAIGDTKNLLKGIWAPFSKIEAAIGSVMIDLQQGDEDGPVVARPPSEFTQTPDYHHEVLTDQGVIRPSETQFATGQLVCKWPKTCPVGSCPLTPEKQAELKENARQKFADPAVVARRLLEPDRDTADFVCRNQFGVCSTAQQGDGAHDANPCSHIVPPGYEDLGGTGEQWFPCWSPQVFQGQFDLLIMPRKVELTIQGYNFHGGLNCMNLVLIPAIKGTCQSFTPDFADPQERFKGQACKTQHTQLLEEQGHTGAALNPCNPEYIFQEVLGEERECAMHGDAANNNHGDGEKAGCQFLHPDPGVRVAPAVQDAHDDFPPPIGLQTATYVIRSENMRIRQDPNSGVANDWFVACLIQPKGPPGEIPPTETGQLIGAFCLKNTDRTHEGNNPTLEPCRHGSDPNRKPNGMTDQSR